MTERTNAHCYETGGLRRMHVPRREIVEQRVMIQASTYNLARVMRALLGVETPEGLTRRHAAGFAGLDGAQAVSGALGRLMRRVIAALQRIAAAARPHAALEIAAWPVDLHPLCPQTASYTSFRLGRALCVTLFSLPRELYGPEPCPQALTLSLSSQEIAHDSRTPRFTHPRHRRHRI